MKIFLLVLVTLCIIQIKTTANEDKVINYARSKVGCGYCWGTLGQKMTESLLAQLIQKHGESKIQPAKQRKYNMGKIVYDCAGLVAKAFNEIGIRPYTSAPSNWANLKYDQKGTISQMPTDKVAILFRNDGTKMVHTGIYIKNNRFVHAKGTDYGVLEESMSQYSWTHYGIPTGLYGSGEIDPPVPIKYPFKGKVIANSGSTVNLREKPNKSAKILTKVKLGEIVTVSGGENGWYNVIYKEFKGYMMMEFVQNIN